VVCNEGYASSLAAAALQNLGTHRATDLVGAYGLARCRPTTTEPAEPIDYATHSPEKQITTGVTPGLARRAIGLKHHDILARPRRGDSSVDDRGFGSNTSLTKRPVHRLVAAVRTGRRFVVALGQSTWRPRADV
jgi:hypothetical protein